MRYEELTIEGRNAVIEAFRSGKTIDKLFDRNSMENWLISQYLVYRKGNWDISQFSIEFRSNNGIVF